MSLNLRMRKLLLFVTLAVGIIGTISLWELIRPEGLPQATFLPSKLPLNLVPTGSSVQGGEPEGFIRREERFGPSIEGTATVGPKTELIIATVAYDAEV